MESVEPPLRKSTSFKRILNRRNGFAPKVLLGVFGSVVCVFALSYFAFAPHRDEQPTVIRIYCASGLTKPVEQLITEYSHYSDAQFEIVRTGGSGELAGQIRTEHDAGVAQGADLYITADGQLLGQLHEQGIVSHQYSLAQQTPVIAAPIQSELQVNDLAELIDLPKIRFGIASERAAIGQLTREIAKAESQLKLLERRKTTDSENVMVLAQALVAGSLEAAVIWDTTVSQINAEYPQSHPRIKTISLASTTKSYRGRIAIGTIGNTEKSESCLAFCRFLSSAAISHFTFEQFGYSFINDN